MSSTHQTLINPFHQGLKPVVKQRYQVNMLSFTFLFTSLILSFAAAQSNTTFDPNAVDLTEKSVLTIFNLHRH